MSTIRALRATLQTHRPSLLFEHFSPNVDARTVNAMNNTKHTTQSTSATQVAPEKKARRNKPGRNNNNKPGRPGRGGTPNPNSPASAKRVEWLAPQLETAQRRLNGLGRDIDRNRAMLIEAGHQADLDQFASAKATLDAASLDAASLDGATNGQVAEIKDAVDTVFTVGRTIASALPARDSKNDRKRGGVSFDEIERLQAQAAKAVDVLARDLAKVTGKNGEAWKAAIVAAGFEPVEADKIVEDTAAALAAQRDWAIPFSTGTLADLEASGYKLKASGYDPEIFRRARLTINAVFNQHREWIEAGKAVKA